MHPYDDDPPAFVAPDFAASLERFVHEYTGSRSAAVKWAPAVFQLYAKLFSEGEVPRQTRAIVNAVLAYFVVPEDLMPEGELGPVGLMDDLYVAAHAFRILRRELPAEILQTAWTGDGDMDDAFEDVYRISRAELGKRSREALRLAGLA